VLCPTAEASLCDALGRPYFLWDCDVTLPQLRSFLTSTDDDVRAYWLAKVMRQAKPDDAIVIGGVDEMRRLWPRIDRTLGRVRPFWQWYLGWIDDGP
jgi:hypothetical protein